MRLFQTLVVVIIFHYEYPIHDDAAIGPIWWKRPQIIPSFSQFGPMWKKSSTHVIRVGQFSTQLKHAFFRRWRETNERPLPMCCSYLCKYAVGASKDRFPRETRWLELNFAKIGAKVERLNITRNSHAYSCELNVVIIIMILCMCKSLEILVVCVGKGIVLKLVIVDKNISQKSREIRTEVVS